MLELKKTKMNYFYTSILICIISFKVTYINGQQLANSSHIPESRAAWNPAFTATGSEMIIDGFFRMQWLGFDGAPVSGFTSVQLPVTGQNMSIGGQLQYDKTGPVSKIGGMVSYAYKLRQILGKNDQISLGISGNFQQYSFSTTGLQVKDDGDPLLATNQISAFYPSIGSGVYYISNTREYKGNSFFAGVAVNQIFTTKILVNEVDQVRKNHIHLNTGGRFYFFDSFLEPMITANIVSPAIVDLLIGLKYEKEGAFWAGAGFSGTGMGAVHCGIIMDEFGDKDGTLKIGVLGNYGLSSALERTGPGFEFYIRYAVPR
ncbi:MAG: PorP/SprF family type IX secretion system membrane protein [Saprospiraceae bacterium]